MHDMSNTRKEIAARLGFAAQGAKATMAAATTPVTLENLFVGHLGNGWTVANKAVTVYGDYEKIANIAYGGAISWTSGFDKSRLDSRVKQYIEKLSLESAQKKAAGEPIARSGSGQGLYSRSGAKAAFDNKQIAQGLSRLLKETGFDGMASDVLSGSSDSETLRKYVRVLKGKMSPLSGDAKSAELLSKLEKMLSSRPGTKTRMTREQTEEQKAGLKIMSAADPAVGAKIATLIKEGKPQDQAVAIALDMKRRGEL